MFDKIRKIAIHEFTTTLKRRSAQFVIFGLPILTVLILIGVNAIVRSQRNNPEEENTITNLLLGEEISTIGIVDETGQITNYPPPTDTLFRPFPDITAARTAFEQGEISGFYLIPANYPREGQIRFYASELSLAATERQLLYQLLLANFLPNERIASIILNPAANYQEIDLSAESEQEATNFFDGLIIGIGTAILFYMTAMGASGYLLQSLGQEKQNRVMEILLSSVRPFELLAGKVIGLGAIGLLQIIVWSVVMLTIFRDQSGFLSEISLPDLKPGIWLIISLHFIVGYLVYAALFAMLGAIMPGVKESSQYTFLIMLPTFIPMWFNGILLTAPNSTFAKVLSFIPLTAPITVPMRLAITAVPGWQWLLSLTLSLLTAIFLLWLATRFFQGRTLLSGQTIKLKQLWQILRQT
ncbi:MAG: ABC transporter permease [Chloroflexi bacterium]|nr:MAG: ABC transporter permease [Chloroflexota bacterium]